jgi:hypothetical protein
MPELLMCRSFALQTAIALVGRRHDLQLVRSLRPTASGRRVIAFMPSGNQARAALSQWDVEISEYNTSMLDGRPMVAFDVYFQGDPLGYIPKDKLRFTVEPHIFSHDGWNLAWWTELSRLRQNAPSFTHTFIICSGSIGGGAGLYVTLLDLLVESPQWRPVWGHSMDQPMLNMIVWEGAASRAGIEYEFTGCDGGFFTVQWCALEQVVKFNEHGQIVSRDILKSIRDSFVTGKSSSFVILPRTF